LRSPAGSGRSAKRWRNPKRLNESRRKRGHEQGEHH
jgi:hypothetical protein